MKINKNKNHIFLRLVSLSVLVTFIAFYLSDSPGKTYLNPFYVDVLALVFGLFLIIDAVRNDGNIYSRYLRTVIGSVIFTIHVLQFIFDFIRY